MSKKLTIQDVQKYIDENGQGKCILLSTEYKNNSTPLDFLCCSCGKQFQRDFMHVKRGRFECPECGYNKRSCPTRQSIDDVKNFIEKYDTRHLCTLLSTEYKNTKTPLKFKCNICGKEFERDFDHLQRDGGIFACTQCSRKMDGKLLHYIQEEVEQDIIKSGYILLEPYINASTPIKCKCSKHNLEFNLRYADYRCGNHGCPECGLDKLRGPNNYRWKGGISPLIHSLRTVTNPWKIKILEEYNYKCDILKCHTNELQVHHLNFNFSDLIREAMQNMNIKFIENSTIGDYAPEDIEKLYKELLRLHFDKVQGVVLDKKIHMLFHSIYGKENNTPEQYYEFKEKIQKGEIIIDGSYSK